MTQQFHDATLALTEAVRAETRLARTGALAQLKQAAEDKQAAFARFRAAASGRDPSQPPTDTERDALSALIAAANESALVLEAVKGVLDDFVGRLKAAVTALADAGTYGPAAWRARDVRAVRIDARA